MAGFGSLGFGTGPFGLGTPLVAPEEPTGSVGSRWINTATKDYEVDVGTNNLKQMPSVRQQVMLAITTIQTSSSMQPRFGVTLPNKMGDLFENQCKQACVAALAHLTDTDPPTIRINKITVTKGRNSRAEILIDYTDLTTGENDQAKN